MAKTDCTGHAQAIVEDDENELQDHDTGLIKSKQHIKFVNQGNYFGEISLITNLKRTASVASNDYCTLSSMSKEVLDLAKDEYPLIYNQF